jgi:hypothetical protein
MLKFFKHGARSCIYKGTGKGVSSQEDETILPWRELTFFSLGRSKRLPQDAQGKPVTLVQVKVQPSHYCLPAFLYHDAHVIDD